MTLPYRLRLMLLINGQPEELVRFRRMATNSDINFYTRGVDVPWWTERPLLDKQCISSRPEPVTTLAKGERIAPHQKLKIKALP